MKHTFKITLILLAMFLTAQIIGLFVVSGYIDFKETKERGEIVFSAPPIGERPQIENESYSFVHIMIAVLLGTLIVFGFVKFKLYSFWKLWYWFALTMCLTYAFGSFFSRIVAISIAVFLASYKVIRPNVIVNNIAEMFLYGGLAAIFVPEFLNSFSVIMLLIAISIYDMYAVWKSKHMVSLAKFQTKSNLFAGLSIPYSMHGKGESKVRINAKTDLSLKGKGKIGKENVGKENKGKDKDNDQGETQKDKKKKVLAHNKSLKHETLSGKRQKLNLKTAILGGGDIGFPLLFSGVILKEAAPLYSFWTAFSLGLIVSVFAGIGLFLLLVYSKKDRFYPAMPFISAGCFAGYGIVRLIMYLFL